MRHRGFTLVELMVALAIIGILTSIGIPLFANYQKAAKLHSEAQILTSQLRYAQQLAITEQKIYNVELLTVSKSYRVRNSQTNVIIKTVSFDPEISFGQITGFTNNIVQFNPTGAALQTGSIILTNSRNATTTIQIKASGYSQIIE